MEELEPQPEDAPEPEETPPAPQTISIEEWMASSAPGVEEAPKAAELEDTQLLAVIEACIYVAEEPLTAAQLAAGLDQDVDRVRAVLEKVMAEFERPEHGVSIREVAGGYKMATKPEHHEAVRSFVKSLKAPFKLSLPALETLAVVAYKQPVTGPEIMEIRGVQGGGVLKTLLERRLIVEAGRKNVIGKPILYKTTREFLIQFGLKDLAELPTLKEFEEIRRMAIGDNEPSAAPPEAEAEVPETEAAALEAEAAPAAEAAVPEAGATAPEADAAPGVEPVAPEHQAAEPEAEAAPPETEAAEPEAEAAAPEADVAPETESAHKTEAAPPKTEAAPPEAEAAPPEAEAAPETEAVAPEAEAAPETEAAQGPPASPEAEAAPKTEAAPPAEKQEQ